MGLIAAEERRNRERETDKDKAEKRAAGKKWKAGNFNNVIDCYTLSLGLYVFRMKQKKILNFLITFPFLCERTY